MQERLTQVLKDFLQEFKENMRQSIAAVQGTLKNRPEETNLSQTTQRQIFTFIKRAKTALTKDWSKIAKG
ncbi:hypothetical protein [Helicobacter felis]|uniref:hypothetical protein n=1 Tax=Helicobacter felis TaxID=214 RepID=UPI001F44370D|nr:hypothetical protein [Helicobacter felis]